MKPVRVPILVSIQDMIEHAQPPLHMSCDWLSDPLALGLMRFPLAIYQKIRELKHGNPVGRVE